MDLTSKERSGRHRLAMVAAVIVSVAALSAFIVQTDLLKNSAGPLLLYAMMMFFLAPFRQESPFIKRIMLLGTLVFVLWLLTDMGILLLPFVLSFFIAYLLDPLVSKLSKWKIQRSISSLLLVLTLVGAVVLISIFVFPNVFQQINDVLRKLSSMVSSSAQYLESRQFYKWLEGFGVSQDYAREVVQAEVVPRLESISQLILNAILAVLNKLASVAAQAINVILIPVLTFYFLNDMQDLKNFIHSTLGRRNERLLNDLVRINGIVRAYIAGQIISATFVGTMATILFLIFHIPYAIVLGVLCGLLNPIPYVGILASLFVAIITILIVNIENAIEQIVIVVVIVNILHFVTTYFIDPRITGSKVGVHPVMLIASLFVFGHFFGFLGLIVAVPVTAVMMMYFNDWREKRSSPSLVFVEQQEGAK